MSPVYLAPTRSRWARSCTPYISPLSPLYLPYIGQVGKELHARSEAIASLQQQLLATEERGTAALGAAQEAIERLAAAQQQAEASLARERDERRAAEEQAAWLGLGLRLGLGLGIGFGFGLGLA